MMAGPEKFDGEVEMQHSEFEALLAEAIDGMLVAATRTRFDAHRAACADCQFAFAEAETGKQLLRELADAEPPRMLVHNILARTTGAAAAEAAAVAKRQGLAERLRGWVAQNVARHVSPIVRPLVQPRFAMSAAMAFFSISIMLDLAGVNVGNIKNVRLSDLRPSTISNRAVSTLAETQGRIVKYYESMRLVYEIESRVRELRNATEQQPAEPQKAPEKRNQNQDPKTSGQPNDKREHDRYVWEMLNHTLALNAPAAFVPEEAK
jgi:hypothetical protein